MSIVIRPIQQDDFEAFNRVVDSVAKEGLWLARLAAPPLAASHTFIAENIAKGWPHFVALDGKKMIGRCDIVGETRETQAHGATLGMGLLKDYRGQGIGRRLIEAAIAAAWAAGFKRIQLTVNADNAAGIALYRKVGFEAEGLFRKAARRPEGYIDVIPMALLARDMLSDLPRL